MYRDTEWSYRPLPGTGHFEIEARVPHDFPDVGRYPCQGFIECLANVDVPHRIAVTSERKPPTRLPFTSRRVERRTCGARALRQGAARRQFAQ